MENNEQPQQLFQVYTNTTQRTFTLKQLRLLSTMTAEQIAKEINVTRATLYAWEKGITQVPLIKLRDLLQLYNVTTQDLNWDHIFEQIDKQKEKDK